MRYNNPSELLGVWSHGVAHGYFRYSHDNRLVFLPDGRGSYCHDGWWRYSLYTFYWHVTPKQQIQFLNIAACEQMKLDGYQFPKLADFSISCFHRLKLRKLTISCLEEEFYMACDDPILAQSFLTPDATGCFGEPAIELPPTPDT